MSHQTKLRKQLKPLFQGLPDQQSFRGSHILLGSIDDLSHFKKLKSISKLKPMDHLKDTCKFNNEEDVQ